MSQQTTRRLTSAAFGLALIGASGIALAGAAQADPNANITFCHATGNPDKFVVVTSDGASIVKQGHGEHQDGRDVIPPFEYVADNSEETVSFPGLNWEDNWATNGEGVATEEVVAADCSPKEEPTPTPTVTVTSTPTPTVTQTPTTTPTMTPTTTPTMTPTGTMTPTPSGPVIETDRVDPAGTNLGLVTGGALLLLAGGATVMVSRRRGSHS